MEKTRKNRAESQGATQAQMVLPVLGLLATVKGALLDLVIGSGLAVLQLLLEQDRELLCGARYQHDPERKATRAGYAPGELVLGGRRVTVKRPRARTSDGKKEVPLPSWATFSAEDPLNARALEQMVLG